MNNSIKTLSTLAAAIAMTATCAPAFAQATEATATPSTTTPTEFQAPQTRDTSDFKVVPGGRLQMLGFADLLTNNTFRSAGRVYLFQKQSRLWLNATKGDYRVFGELNLGGEDFPGSNTNYTLSDLYGTGPLFGGLNWRLGQFRVPYGRELMDEGGSLSFNDRSIVAPFLNVGRDIGASLSGNMGPANVILGVWSGGGRDNPQRYLPEILGIPELATRITFGDPDSDLYTYSQHDYVNSETMHQGLGLSVLFTRDSLVGHSTILGVKNKFDKSLLLNGDWNPYIGKKDADGHAVQGELWQYDLDYAFTQPLGVGVLKGQAEVDYGKFGNQFGTIGVLGGSAQAAINMNPVEVALRYGIVFPDKNMAVTNATAGPNLGKTTAIMPDGTPIQEITPAISYFINGDKLKLTLDFPIYLNSPVVTEKGLGNYNLVNQNDQTPLLNTPTNFLTRQTVFAVRGGVTAGF